MAGIIENRQQPQYVKKEGSGGGYSTDQRIFVVKDARKNITNQCTRREKTQPDR